MEDDDFLPLSALQHLVYCPRQCALIHVQQVWDDNRFTAEGHVLHRRVDEMGEEYRGTVRIARGVSLVCRRLGLVGLVGRTVCAFTFWAVAAAASASSISAPRYRWTWKAP